MNDNSKIWQLCLDTLEKQELPDSRKIDKIIMESVFRSAKISSINDNKVVITTPYSFNVETIKNNQKDIEEILSGMLASPITVEILGEEDFKKALSSLSYFEDNNAWGTPLTIAIKDKVVVNDLVGFTDKQSDIDDFFKSIYR